MLFERGVGDLVNLGAGAFCERKTLGLVYMSEGDIGLCWNRLRHGSNGNAKGGQKIRLIG